MQNLEVIKMDIQKHLESTITSFSLKASGLCNDAYLLKTKNRQTLIVKQGKKIQEFKPQNSLIIEARVVQKVSEVIESIPVPQVVFVGEEPDMYGYQYLEGRILKDVWPELSEVEKVHLCKKLGKFHAEIGQKVNLEQAQNLGIFIDKTSDVHPETLEEYKSIIKNPQIPELYRKLVIKAKEVLDTTADDTVFQFIHNDTHHENILIDNKEISGIIDFGNAEYGEIAKEFSRYIRDIPEYFQYIVASYEERSGNKVSQERLVSFACVSGFIDIVEGYLKGGVAEEKADKTVQKYKELLSRFERL